MLVDRIAVRILGGDRVVVQAFLNSEEEIAIWRAEWVHLGFELNSMPGGMAFEIGLDSGRELPMAASEAGERPLGDLPAMFGRWFALREVERYRAMREFMRCQQDNGAAVESHNEGSGI